MVKKLNETKFKFRSYYYLDDIININDLNHGNILIEKKEMKMF